MSDETVSVDLLAGFPVSPGDQYVRTAHDTGDGWAFFWEDGFGNVVEVDWWPADGRDWITANELRLLGFEIV